MNMCADKPECPYRVVIAAHLIDEVRFAVSPEDAAAAVAEDRELPALLEGIEADVAEAPGGRRRRYLIRAYPVMVYEAEAIEAGARRCQACDAEACADDSHGRRASVASDPLAAPGRPGSDSPDGCP